MKHMMQKNMSIADDADSENKQLFANSSVPKRKFEEIQDKNEFQYTFFPKFLSISDSSYLKKENYWEQYTNLKPCIVKNYSSLLPKSLIPNFMDSNNKFYHEINSLSCLNDAKFCMSVQRKAFTTSVEEFFTTAAGKSINISNNAMLAAQRLIHNMFQDDTHQKIDCLAVKKKQFIKVASLNILKLIPCATRNHNDDEIITKEINSKSINKNNDFDVSYETDTASFSTAAGKKIYVSEAAMKAASKFIQDDDHVISLKCDLHMHKKKSTFKDIGCPSKKLLTESNDHTMDKDFLEKFFQNDVFNEKKSQDITECSKIKDFSEVLESKTSNNPTTVKIRKSLGGRRRL